ncbi:MAG: DNA polymerase III subunit delta [Actinomycetota bacterium]|nr:DNA polymerase III subunit delta [Actinomycetota bacterium]
MPAFKAAYLVHGDDHGRISERRARLRALAESESGSGGVEIFEGDTATPENVGLALSAMTFAMGRRFLIVDGVERWKDADIETALTPLMKDMPDLTTVTFFAREEGRFKVPAKLVAAVKSAGGDIAREQALKAKDLPRWVSAEGARLGITVDAAGARALVGHVGERQQRLLRELEKLALEHGQGAAIGLEEVDAAAAPSAEHQVWGFVDALVARDRRRATVAYLELRAQGESLPRLVPLVARRLRDVLAIAARLEAGESPAQVKGSIKGSPWAAGRRIDEARVSDAASLRASLEALSELELTSRGLGELSDDTAALRAIAAIAA